MEVDLNGEPRVVQQYVPLDGTGASMAVLWLNRPHVLNPIDTAMLIELERVLAEVDADDDVAAVMISGRGRAFSAGGDMKAYLSLQQDPTAFPEFVDRFQRVFGAIKYMRKPVVALVNGITAAGGLELMLACDFAYAAETARIGDAHLNYGQMGGGGALALLPRAVGPARARELLFSGRLLTASEALDIGLVNRVVPDGDLLATGQAFAAEVATKSPIAVQNVKYVMNAGWADGTGLPEALRLERDRALLYCLTQPHSMEGLRAFAERRTPEFRRRGEPVTESPALT